MSRTLLAVTFDAEIRLAPRHKPDRVIALTDPKAWAGWRIEVRGDTVHVFSPPVGPREDADEIMRLGASTCETVIPRHRCVLSWAHAPGATAALEVPAVPLELAASEPHVVTVAVPVVKPPPPPAPAPVQAAAPAPTPRRRVLPPGAEPVMTPPPSKIDAKVGSEPNRASALVVDEGAL